MPALLQPEDLVPILPWTLFGFLGVRSCFHFDLSVQIKHFLRLELLEVAVVGSDGGGREVASELGGQRVRCLSWSKMLGVERLILT